MPDFTFIDMDDKPYTQHDLPKERPTVMLFFNPDCDHCQSEADSLTKRAKDFQHVNILWIAVSDKAEMHRFDSTYHLTFNAMTMLRDTGKKAGKWFAVKDVPSIILFDKNSEIINKYAGTISANRILEEIGER
jgi:thiol-disulfide isomerase/thioredoxin